MEDVRFFFGSGLRLSFGVTAAIYGLYYAFGPVLLTLFIKEANLFPVAYDALRMYELSTLVGSLNIVYIIPAVFGRESVWFPIIAAELITLILAVIVKKRFERRADPPKKKRLRKERQPLRQPLTKLQELSAEPYFCQISGTAARKN